jgi:hypothetical protein
MRIRACIPGPVAIAVALLTLGPATAAAQSPLPIKYSAVAVSLGAPPGQVTLPIDVTVTRWSSPAERDMVVTTLAEQPGALLDVLKRMPPVGRLTTTGIVGHELRYAVLSSSGGTDRILLLTDRPIGMGEAMSGNRTLAYPFTVIELRVGPSGRGDGRIVVAAKLGLDPPTRSFVVEDYSISSVQLHNVRRQDP